MNKTIIIAGGTGFAGKYLSQRFQDLGYTVNIISRQPGHINWDYTSAIAEVLENSEMLINLAGRSVDCRYNEKNKKEIYNSRIETTRTLGLAILKCKNPPKLWMNSSTATIYRHAEDRPMTESTGDIGKGFSVNVATNWERAFFDFMLPNTRQVALRMAIVLGRDGGVIRPLKNLVRFGLGGKQGKGNQVFSWIHIEDLLNVIVYLQQHKELAGVFNASSPNPVNNMSLMQFLREKMKVKIGLPSPIWLLKIGAMIINTETELVLKSRWVIPERLLRSGFEFKYPRINDALENILGKP
jgi:uncharacterized protein (TIGR01777 family)